jgi:putative ABC transport system permease protein
VGVVGLRTRPLRALLSALGIAIGIAAMMGVIGVSASGRAAVQKTLDALGTNLLIAQGGGDGSNKDSTGLPNGAVSRIERIAPVQNASALSSLPDAVHVYRNDHVPTQQTSGIVPYAADLDLPATVGATLVSGTWLNAAIANYPGVVLGYESAGRLGITKPGPGVLLQIGGERFAVVGILNPVPLVPDLDSSALIGVGAAKRYLGASGLPRAIYVRAADNQVAAVRDVLAATANPAAPYEVVTSRPSDALEAKLATERAFNGLLVGLGGVALLVGAVGVANTMVISVLERRPEIGLRRSLGATRGQIRSQFFMESLLLAVLGGVGGVALGVLVTLGFAFLQDWPPTVPGWAVVAGLAATMAVGAIAGLYPAIRASRLSPTEALTAI